MDGCLLSGDSLSPLGTFGSPSNLVVVIFPDFALLLFATERLLTPRVHDNDDIVTVCVHMRNCTLPKPPTFHIICWVVILVGSNQVL